MQPNLLSNHIYTVYVVIQSLVTTSKYISDIDECTRGISGCEHKCINSIGSFKCSCNKGYHLAIDAKSCSGNTFHWIKTSQVKSGP